MTRGRKPLPKELKQLHGTLQPCRDRPSSTIGEVIKVEDIGSKCQISGLKSATKRAREIYWSLVRKVAVQGMLDEAFLSQLYFYAVEYDHFMKCTESIKKEGLYLVIEGKKGTIVVQNPAVKQRENALTQLLKIGSNFGFSPVDRQRLKLQKEDPKAKGIKAIFGVIMNEDQEPEEQ